MTTMTDEQLADIRKWLEQASEPCGNDACIGEWAAVHGRALLDEVERLRDAKEGEAVSDDELKAIRARCEAATPGPWIREGAVISSLRGVWYALKTSADRADLSLMFHACEDIPALLAEVERLRADAELGRMVRGELYGRWINSGKIATLAVMDGNWFCSTEDDLGPGYDTPEDALRAAVADAGAQT